MLKKILSNKIKILTAANIILFSFAGCAHNNPKPPKKIEIQKDNIIAMQQDFDLYIRDSFKRTDKFINNTEKAILLLKKKQPSVNEFIYYK